MYSYMCSCSDIACLPCDAVPCVRHCHSEGPRNMYHVNCLPVNIRRQLTICNQHESGFVSRGCSWKLAVSLWDAFGSYIPWVRARHPSCILLPRTSDLTKCRTHSNNSPPNLPAPLNLSTPTSPKPLKILFMCRPCSGCSSLEYSSLWVCGRDFYVILPSRNCQQVSLYA